MRIRRRLERGGVEFIVVHQPDGSFACLPAWMTHDTACRLEIGMTPAFSLTTLRALRSEVDALLGLLASESPTERAEHDAPMQKSPAGPPRVALRPKQKAELAATVEALLREIAAALARAANRESGDDQDHD